MSDLAGQTVTDVRPMTEDEMSEWGWATRYQTPPPVIEFEDGSKVYPLQDPEGNGPGDLVLEQDGRKYGFYFD